MSNTAGNFLSDGKQMVKVKSFGDALKLLIAESGKTYHDVANAVGCTKGDLKEWEENKVFPNANQLQRLFSIFRRLRHFAQQFARDKADEISDDSGISKTAAAIVAVDQLSGVTPDRQKIVAEVIGEIGDLEIAAIEYARAMRAHSTASMKTIALKKEYDAACAESERLAKLVDTLDASFRSKAGRA